MYGRKSRLEHTTIKIGTYTPKQRNQPPNRACPDGRLFCTFAGRFHDPTNSTTGLNTLGAACGQAGGVPLVVFGDHRGGSGTEERRRELTLVLSPMDTFMAANVVLERGEGEEGRRAVLRYGVQGRVSFVLVWLFGLCVFGMIQGNQPTYSH